MPLPQFRNATNNDNKQTWKNLVTLSPLLSNRKQVAKCWSENKTAIMIFVLPTMRGRAENPSFPREVLCHYDDVLPHHGGIHPAARGNTIKPTRGRKCVGFPNFSRKKLLIFQTFQGDFYLNIHQRNTLKGAFMTKFHCRGVNIFFTDIEILTTQCRRYIIKAR